MRVFTMRLLALGLAIGVAGTLIAQQRGGFMGGGGSMSASMLLGQKSVQEEIKLTDDQVTKVKKINEEIRAKYGEEMKSAGKDREKFAELRKKMDEDTTKALADVVKPDQMKRVKQIEVQLGGLAALSKDENKKALKLTDKQETALKTASEEVQKDSRELFKDAGKDFAGVGEKVRKLNQEAAAKFVKTLSAEQQKTYTELTGPEFKGKIERTGFGGRPDRKSKDKGDREE